MSSLGHGNYVGDNGAMEHGRHSLASDAVGAPLGENISSETVKDLSVIWDDDHTNEINLNLNLNESSDPIGDESDDDVMMRSLSDCGNSRITEYQRLTTYGFDPRDKPSDGYTKDKAYGLRLWEPYSQR